MGRNLKHSSKIYRNIGGVKYVGFCSMPNEIEHYSAQMKQKGIKFKIVNKGEELLIEQGKENEIDYDL